MKCLGIDIGGTFTDFILVDSEKGMVHVHKVSSTPKNQSIGTQHGLDLFKDKEIEIMNLDVVVHGTTVATNAILERKGVKTALLATKGFTDVIEIGRQNRSNLYSFYPKRVDPLIPRQLRFGISERVGSEGNVILPLDPDTIHQVIQKIQELGVESVAISLLFSFFNPTHEIEIAQIIRKALPNLHISRSSWVLPVFREYDRTSVTVLDAYIAPLMKNYFDSFLEVVHKQKITNPPLILLSSGGVTQIKNAAERSVETVLSGLAGGVLGGYYSSQLLQVENIITLDIGGTSTDVASIVNGNIEITSENTIAGYPIPLPTIAVQTIGAGGGSIARQKYGILHVGPESAGADPGPACYEKGGNNPTVTDANLVRRLLNPDYFCNGSIKISSNRAAEVIGDLSKQLTLKSDEETAEGVIEVFENNIALALRKVSTEKGLDSRNFTLCCFGGGGPLHACSLAERLSMTKVIIPPYPGVWSAFGLLTADIKHDLTQSIIKPLNQSVRTQLDSSFDELVRDGVKLCIEDGFSQEDIIIVKNVDIRLVGQSYEITVPYTSNIEEISKLFDKAHEKAYGYSSPDAPHEIINIRVSAIVTLPKFSLARLPQGSESPSPKSFLEVRNVYINGGWKEANVYQKSLLSAGNKIIGPSIIEQADSTILVDIGWKMEVLEDGHIVMNKTSGGENEL
ncbi:MAG: hydantoinase/oxoprolinase family protein [Candidatus Hodarchaeales archaeon]|jgi:N-methylhydantoinase A